MGNNPYVQPLGIHTAIGRAWLEKLRRDKTYDVGNRLVNGEIIYRNKKVLNIRIDNDFMTGFTIQAHVLSQDRVKSGRGEYFNTTLSVDPYSPKDRRKALAIIHETKVWKELLLSEPAVNRKHPSL